MRTAFDFAPLFRSSVGFDRVLNLLESASRIDPTDSWPAYDIIRTGEESYRITMVVAGFAAKELNIVHEPNLLVVLGKKSDKADAQYLHHGIATREFKRQFELADHVKVAGANLADGLLTIDLEVEIPENLKPRMIEIHARGPGDSSQQIGVEGQPSAA